jgi:hypothetical protein
MSYTNYGRSREPFPIDSTEGALAYLRNYYATDSEAWQAAKTELERRVREGEKPYEAIKVITVEWDRKYWRARIQRDAQGGTN